MRAFSHAYGDDPADLFDLREDMARRGVMICFNGPFSHSIIEELGKAVRRYLEAEDLAKPALMDVFSVYIEQTQNVQRYITQADFRGAGSPGVEHGTVVISRREEGYEVASGNVVAARDIPALNAWLEQLNRASPAELKTLFKERMRQGPGSEAHGAGLGLLDMARKSREPLAWSFRHLDEGHAFFSLRVRL